MNREARWDKLGIGADTHTVKTEKNAKPEFGKLESIRLAREGAERAKHANCKRCEGRLTFRETCWICGGDGKVEERCDEIID